MVVPPLIYLLGFQLSALTLFWVGSVAPATLAAGIARFFPEARAWWHGVSIPLLDKWQQADQQGHDWEADWVREMGTGRRQRPGQGSSASFENEGRFHNGSRGDPKGYYSLLGVPHSASISEIQAAFRAAAFRYHPDQSGGSPQSTEKLQQVLEAYATLRNPDKRREYDQT